MTPRRGFAVVVVLAMLTLVTACRGNPAYDAGGDVTSYCQALAKKQALFATDNVDGGQGLLPGLPDFEELAKKAPDDLDDEWQVFVNALRGLSTAISDAGISPQDIVAGKRPDGLADDKWAAIKAAANVVSSGAVADALNGIDQQAKDVCQLQLGL